MQRFRSHVQTPSLSEPTLPELKKNKNTECCSDYPEIIAQEIPKQPVRPHAIPPRATGQTVSQQIFQVRFRSPLTLRFCPIDHLSPQTKKNHTTLFWISAMFSPLSLSPTPHANANCITIHASHGRFYPPAPPDRSPSAPPDPDRAASNSSVNSVTNILLVVKRANCQEKKVGDFS